MNNIYSRAKAEIEKRGWCQHEFQDGHGAVCTWGALNLAVGYTAEGDEFVDNSHYEDGDEAWVAVEQARWAVPKFAGVQSGVTFWNDHPSRTVEEVLTVLGGLAERTEADA